MEDSGSYGIPQETSRATTQVTPQRILEIIKAKVIAHEPDGGIQWYVDEASIDVDACEFWQVILRTLNGMVAKESKDRGGKGGVCIDGVWYFQPTDGLGCPTCGAIGSGGHGGGCQRISRYNEAGEVIPGGISL